MRRGRRKRRGVANDMLYAFLTKDIPKTPAVGSPGSIVDTPLCKLRDALCMPFSFVKDLGLALVPKTCPDQSQAFEEGNISQAFTVSSCSKACLLKV